MREELDKIYEIATRVLAEPPDGDTAPLVEICTLIEAVSQRKKKPWTPRERSLRAALEPFAAQCQEIENEAHMALQVGGYLPVDQPDISIDMWAAHGIKWRHLLAARAALADQPPPDQRDEALRLAEEAIRGVLDIGKRDMSNPKYDGYFDDMDAALAAIAAAKGEK